MLDMLQETIASRNIIGWIIIVVLLILFIKLLQNVGKVVFLVAAVAAGIFVIMHYFPDIAEPITEFIRGSWMGESFLDSL